MIKINLLKSELPKQPLTSLTEASTGSRKILVTVALIALIGVAAYFARGLFMPSSEEPVASAAPEPATTASAVVETPPEPPPIEPAAPATGDAVEDIVTELTRSAEAAPKPRGYVDLVPSERVDYQLQTVQRILKDVKAITPVDVGFAQFIFTPPGEFYVHGLAYNPESLERFKAGLQALPGAQIREGKNVVVGAGSRKVQEFSFYCQVEYPMPNMGASPDRVVQSNKVDAALRNAVSMAEGMGLKLHMPKLTGTENAGGVKRLVFATETEASYDKLQDFLEQLRTSQAPFGVLRVSLRARGDEDMIADLDLVAYVGGRPGG